MLQFMRQRASSWMIKAILSIIVLAFIFMGVRNFRDRNDVAAATVNGKKISIREFQDRYYLLLDEARRQFGDQLNDDLMNMLNLKARALDQLISERVLIQKARALGMQVSDQEVAGSIRDMSFFQRDGRFSRALYNSILQRNRLTPEMFEQQQRRSLLTEKLRQLIAGSVKVSEDEVRRWYDWQNVEIKIRVAAFKPENYLDITPSEDALKAYFDENKQEYKTPGKIQVTYLPFNADDFTAAVSVDDAAVQQYYEDHRDSYRTEKTVEISHILIKMPPNPPEKMVADKQAEAMKIYEKVTAGRDFADCAREYSEDAASAAQGGVLGAFQKKGLDVPLAEQVFSMQAGDISPPVQGQSGWHILKVDRVNEASVALLTEVKPDIEKTLIQKQARDLAYEAALGAFDAAINLNSVKKAAAQLEMEAPTTPLFSRADNLAEIAGSDEFISQAFDLLQGEISDVVEAGGVYYIFQVDQRLAPKLPELAAVRERVSDDLSAEMREEKAKAAAASFLKALQNGSGFEMTAKETSASLVTTDYFKRRDPVPEIGNEAELSREAFRLTPDRRVADKVIEGVDGYYVLYLEDRRSPTKEAFTDEKDQITAQLLQFKKDNAFSAWLSAMKAESEITRDERFLK